MKKNLRIISASAAALLAIAPVAASTVNTANADVTVNGDTQKPTTPDVKADGTITVNISLTASNGTTVKDAINSANVTVDGATLVNFNKANNLHIATKDAPTKNLSDDTKLAAGTQYVVTIDGFQVQGLTTGKTYDVKGGTLSGVTQNANKSYDASALDGKTAKFTSDEFQVYNTDQTGTVSFMQDKTIVSSGNVDYAGTTTVSGLAKEITDKYQPTVANGTATVKWNDAAVKTAVENALTSNGVTVNGDTIVKAPVSSFKISVPATASNGKSANLDVTVNVTSKATSSAPEISTDNKNYTKVSDTNYTLNLAQNASDTAESIAKDFTAKYNGTNGSTGSYNAKVNVKSSNLNTAVVGKYQVVLTATNPETKVSKDVTIDVTVGNPGETKTVEAGTDTAKIVTIDGNKVTTTDQTLSNGSKVSTYGNVTVDNVSYTRLNSEYSNQYVETKYVDGSIKPVDEKSASTQIMYKSAIYDKDGKSTGKTIAGYEYKDLVTENGSLKEYTINGSKFYKIAGEDSYVRTRNVTGTKMTLKKNAYEYKSNGKRANKKVDKKNTTVTVYGGKYKAIKGYKGEAVRVGVNKYIKVSNVNYKLAD